jgi:hypothetical protein
MARPHPVHGLARAVLAAMLVLGAAGLAAATVGLLAAIASLKGPPGAAHDVAVGGIALTYPSANLAALVVLTLAGVGVLTVALGLRAVARHGLAAWRLRRRLTAGARPLPGGHVLLPDRRPVAFCAGLLRPRVYVSEGALGALAPAELRAVLAHEEQHRARRDPLRVLVASCLAEALFFVPAVGRLRDRYAAVAELRADDAAVEACAGDAGPLAGAMTLFDATAGIAGVAPERVDRLLGAPPRPDLGRAPLALGGATVAAMLVVAWQAGQAAVFRATFAPPGLSHRPCVLALAGLPVALGTLVAAGRGVVRAG